MSKAKQLGTAWETVIVNRLKTEGFTGAARIAEGGPYDIGDVGYFDETGTHWVIECKARANLNVTQALAKAKAKAADGLTGAKVIVAWKKLTRKQGNERRSADGEPDVVIMDWDTYMMLVNPG